MARVGKYQLAELERQKESEKYQTSLRNYVMQKKVTSASRAELIEMIFKGEVYHTSYFLESDNPKYWTELITRVKGAKSAKYLETLKRILLHIATVSDTFFIEIESIRILFSIAQLEDDFIRPVEDWVPKSRNRFKQIYELLRHLFAKYEVPEFLDQGFIKGEFETISLFLNIGAGKSFKEFEFTPNIVLNKKVYHHLFTTPVEFSFFEAFRRAQILSIGGTENLVYNVLGTFLKRTSGERENFWITIFHFFVNQPMFDYNKVGPIIDYINEKKYVSRNENGRVLPPEQPNFEIKGRTIQALLRQTEEWHNQLAYIAKATTINTKRLQNAKSWDGIKIKNFAVELTNKQKYEIIQYKTATELMQDGREMHHCVGSYTYSCASGRVSIWSMRLMNNNGFEHKKILTIELDNSNLQIVQVRGKNNRKADNFELSVMNLWVNKSNLTVSRYI